MGFGKDGSRRRVNFSKRYMEALWVGVVVTTCRLFLWIHSTL